MARLNEMREAEERVRRAEEQRRRKEQLAEQRRRQRAIAEFYSRLPGEQRPSDAAGRSTEGRGLSLTGGGAGVLWGASHNQYSSQSAAAAADEPDTE